MGNRKACLGRSPQRVYQAVFSEEEKEHAARAIECGYIYREGDMLYTKILVSDRKDKNRLFAVTYRLEGYLDENAGAVAEKVSGLIRKFVPEYLLGEWELANALAGMIVYDSLVDYMIGMKMLTPPENGLGAEGCWIELEK